jgi:hypothetical protein
LIVNLKRRSVDPFKSGDAISGRTPVRSGWLGVNEVGSTAFALYDADAFLRLGEELRCQTNQVAFAERC